MAGGVADILERMPDGMSLAELARIAGMNPDHLRQIHRGRRRATAGTLAQLRLALTRVRSRQADAPQVEVALYRSLLALVAVSLHLDPLTVQTADPAAKAAPNAAWRAGAHARWLAQYLMNCGLGVKQTAVARACGVTKQAVGRALQEVELRREGDAEFGRVVERLEAILMGER